MRKHRQRIRVSVTRYVKHPEMRAWGLKQLRARIERARAEGDLPQHIKPGPFACYLALIMSGLAHQAASGATLAELKRVIEMFRETMPIT